MIGADQAQFQKKSLSLLGHKTSVSLEKAFWDVLEKDAKEKGQSLSKLVISVDKERTGGLASALRLYALKVVQEEHRLIKARD